MSIVSLTLPPCARLLVRPRVFGHGRKRSATRRWNGCVSWRGVCRWRNTPASTYCSGYVSSCDDELKSLTGNVTQVSWKKALGVLDARIATASPACGKKLRYWKEVIADVYSDFSAKLPDAELPTLAMRASWEDGRTEGSRYPNLLLREAMEEYGI